MTARLNPSNKASSNVPFSPKPPESTSSQAPTAEKASTHPDTATPAASPSQSKETSASQSKETSASQSKETSASSFTAKEPSTKASSAEKKSTSAALRNAYEASKYLLAPGQVLTAKGLEVMMNQAAYKPGESTKIEFSAEATATKGTFLKQSLSLFAKLGLSFTKEDAGHVQIQFNAEAAAKIGLSVGELAKLGVSVGVSGKITLRFNSAQDAAAWVANALGKVNLSPPLFQVAPVSLPHSPPTRIWESGTSASVEAGVAFSKSLGVEAQVRTEQVSQTFVLPNGEKVQGARTTHQGHVKGELAIGQHKIEFQREVTQYTQVHDPVHTNNGTYRQEKYSFKVPAALLTGHKDKVMSALAELIKKAGLPSLSAQGMERLYLRFSNAAKQLGNAAYVGLSLEWNSVKEGDQFKTLNRRVFLNMGVEKEKESPKFFNVKGLGKIEAKMKAEASTSQILHEKVYGRSEAYLSQVYTGQISKQAWSAFEDANKPALQSVVKNHRKTYPRGAVETAYQEALQRTKDPNKANQAALEALKKIWTDTYKAKSEIERDAITVFNKLTNGKSTTGEVVWKSFPLPKTEREAIENLLMKYKDKPKEMALLKTQLTHWLGEGSLQKLQSALQVHTGGWLYSSLHDGGAAYQVLSPNSTFEGNNKGQAEQAADTITALSSKIKGNSLSEDEKQQIEKAIAHAAKIGYLPALKALLVRSFGDGDKNLTTLQKALQKQNGTDSRAYILLADTPTSQR